MPEHCPDIVRTGGHPPSRKGELIRKHLMAVLSVLGLTGSSMPAQAQRDAKDKAKDAATERKQKEEKANNEQKAAADADHIKKSVLTYKEQKAAEEQNPAKLAKEYKEQKAAQEEAAHKGELNIKKAEKTGAELKAAEKRT